jgi:hypothetical protein
MDRSHFLHGTGKTSINFPVNFAKVEKNLNLGCGINPLKHWSFRVNTIVKKCAYHKFDDCVFCLLSEKKDTHEHKNILSYNVLWQLRGRGYLQRRVYEGETM